MSDADIDSDDRARAPGPPPLRRARDGEADVPLRTLPLNRGTLDTGMLVALQQALQLGEALSGTDRAEPPVELDPAPVENARLLEDDRLAAAALAPVAREANSPTSLAAVEEAPEPRAERLQSGLLGAHHHLGAPRRHLVFDLGELRTQFLVGPRHRDARPVSTPQLKARLHERQPPVVEEPRSPRTGSQETLLLRRGRQRKPIRLLNQPRLTHPP